MMTCPTLGRSIPRMSASEATTHMIEDVVSGVKDDAVKWCRLLLLLLLYLMCSCANEALVLCNFCVFVLIYSSDWLVTLLSKSARRRYDYWACVVNSMT